MFDHKRLLIYVFSFFVTSPFPFLSSCFLLWVVIRWIREAFHRVVQCIGKTTAGIVTIFMIWRSNFTYQRWLHFGVIPRRRCSTEMHWATGAFDTGLEAWLVGCPRPPASQRGTARARHLRLSCTSPQVPADSGLPPRSAENYKQDDEMFYKTGLLPKFHNLMTSTMLLNNFTFSKMSESDSKFTVPSLIIINNDYVI